MAVIRSIHGIEIDYAMTLAMEATVKALYEEGIITGEEATNFADTHICVNVTNENLFRRISRYLGFTVDDNTSYPTILKVVERKSKE